MSGTAFKGSRGILLLTLAQAWHALTGYFIFLHVSWDLGKDLYGAFTLVLWTMTTLEVFVIDGIPRAVSYFTARRPHAAASTVSRGLLWTFVIALGFAGALVLAAPAIARAWGREGLVAAIRISALDFLAFVGFAVLVQAVNGLQRFSRQAAIWFVYSSAKVAAVLLALGQGAGIDGTIAAYAVASLVGSAGALLLGWPLVRHERVPDPPTAAAMMAFGLPVATQAIALLALVNVDLWAAAPHATAAELGIYGAAATLGRALFFIFKAFGDALFPGVARRLALGQRDGAQAGARHGFALLLVVLLPAVGLATGTAETVLAVLFRDPAFAAGGRYLHWMAPGLAAWTLTAVLAALLSAAARPWRAASFLILLFVIVAGGALAWASADGPMGAARATCVGGIAGFLSALALVRVALGNVAPLRALIPALLAGLILNRALTLWHPGGALVFLYGALLYGATVLALLGARVLPAKDAAARTSVEPR